MLRISTTSAESEFDESFGAKESDWSKLIQSAADLKINLVGVSFHIGQNCDQFPIAIAQVGKCQFFRNLKKFGLQNFGQNP